MSKIELNYTGMDQVAGKIVFNNSKDYYEWINRKNGSSGSSGGESGGSSLTIDEIKNELIKQKALEDIEVEIVHWASSKGGKVQTKEGWKGDIKNIVHSGDVIPNYSVNIALFGDPEKGTINGIGVVGCGSKASSTFPKSKDDGDISYYSLHTFSDISDGWVDQGCEVTVYVASKKITGFSTLFKNSSYGCFVYNIDDSIAKSIMNRIYDSIEGIVINPTRFGNVDSFNELDDDKPNCLLMELCVPWLDEQIDNHFNDTYILPVSVSMNWLRTTILPPASEDSTKYTGPTEYIYDFFPLKIKPDATPILATKFRTDTSISPGVYVGFVSHFYESTATSTSKYPVGVILYRHIGPKVAGGAEAVPDNIVEYMYPVYVPPSSSSGLTDGSHSIFGNIDVLIKLNNGKVIKSGFTAKKSNDTERDFIYIKIDDADNPKFYLDELMFNMSGMPVSAYKMTLDIDGTAVCDTIIIDGKNKGKYPLDVPSE